MTTAPVTLDTSPRPDPARVRHCLARARPGELEQRLLDWVANALVDRLDGIRLHPRRILVLGGRETTTARLLRERFPTAQLVTAALTPTPAAVTVEPEHLPWRENTFDLLLSPFVLHWSRDLAASLRQLRRVMAPGGLLLAALPGEHTLQELKESLASVDAARGDEPWPRLLPLPEMRALGDLLAATGFTLPVVDRDWLELTPPDLPELLAALRRLGSGNPHGKRAPTLRGRGWLDAVAATYRARHGRADGALNATVELLFAHAVKKETTARTVD